MLTIRLTRVGKKKYPTYRVIVSEKSRDPWGRFLEQLGNYNPHTKEKTFNKERILHWLEKGAQPSATVYNLLVNAGIIKEDKKKHRRSVKITKRRNEKLQKAQADKASKDAEKKAANTEVAKSETEDAPKEKEEKVADSTEEKTAETTETKEKATEEKTEKPVA